MSHGMTYGPQVRGVRLLFKGSVKFQGNLTKYGTTMVTYES